MAYAAACDLLKPYPANFWIRSNNFSAFLSEMSRAFAPSRNLARSLSISSGFFLPIARRRISAWPRENPATLLAIAITCS